METGQGLDKKIALFVEIFSPLKDKRRISNGNIRYSLHEILFLTLSAVVSGCNTWETIEEFGQLKIGWFRKFFPYRYGTPSHDTLGAFFSSLNSKEFGKCFMEYTKALAKVDSNVIAIDGKTVRGAASNHRNSPLHIVTAFCENNKLSLAQEVVDDKENEIVAIPKLLDIIDLEGAVVTIDAMGCQKEIAQKIIEKKADYILQVKDNQKGLNEQIEKLFTKTNNIKEEIIDYDMGHGRVEKRTCRIIEDLTFLDEKEGWKGLNTIVEIESEIANKQTGKVSRSKRHYISSLQAMAIVFLKSIRGHWSIEKNGYVL